MLLGKNMMLTEPSSTKEISSYWQIDAQEKKAIKK